jgi:hypothetical protein
LSEGGDDRPGNARETAADETARRAGE